MNALKNFRSIDFRNIRRSRGATSRMNGSRNSKLKGFATGL